MTILNAILGIITIVAIIVAIRKNKVLHNVQQDLWILNNNNELERRQTTVLEDKLRIANANTVSAKMTSSKLQSSLDKMIAKGTEKPQKKRGRGRPTGSKNKPKQAQV